MEAWASPRSRAERRQPVDGLDGFPLTLHEARHTAPSLLAAADVAPEVAGEWLGYDPAVYLRTYVHPTPDRVARGSRP